jgi:NADH:ubiquinone oxidoreductase subunit 3 (subunit A)
MLYSEIYLNLFIYLLFCGALSCLIFGFSLLLAYQNPNVEKVSVYECGFEPYEDARNIFEIKFFLLALFFLIFDIEALFLFPWVISLDFLTNDSFWYLFDFFFELFLSFIYVWLSGGLIWD